MLSIQQVEDEDAPEHPALLLARENRKLHRQIFELTEENAMERSPSCAIRAGVSTSCSREAGSREPCGSGNKRSEDKREEKQSKMFEIKGSRFVQVLGAPVRSRRLLTCGRWVFAFGLLAIALMQQSALAAPRACLPPGDNAQCTRDSECCDGSVCAGVCKRGCKINKVFYANGTINQGNDCQWCQAATNRFGWTNRASGAFCGSGSDTDCDNPNTCNGSGSCRANHELDDTACTTDGNDCTSDVCAGGACTHPNEPEDTACGSGSNTDCDNPNTCDATGTCLQNHEPATTTCGDTGTECTNQDACDPATGLCKDNGYKPDTMPCTDTDETNCQAAECNGSGVCDQGGGYENSGYTCGSQGDTVCDNPNTCDATGTCLQNHEPATTTCGDPGAECTNQDACDPATGLCKDNGYKSDTTACTDTTPTGCNAAECNGSGACDQNGGYEDLGHACGNQSDIDCDAPNTCDATGTCRENLDADGTACTSDGIACTIDVCAGGVCGHPIAPAASPCIGTANGGLCDDDAKDHCDDRGACVDVFRPSSHACVLPLDANGRYACREVAYCTGTTSTCQTPDINVFDPTIPCRETAFNSHPTCDPPEYCVGYEQCALPQHVDATCDGGPRDGQWCDIYEEEVLGHPQCGSDGLCKRTVCGQGTGCQNPSTCTPGGQCISNGFLPAGTECSGDFACEKYRCDATGTCVDQNETKGPTARCRAAANACDVADFCGDPESETLIWPVKLCDRGVDFGRACTTNADCRDGAQCAIDPRNRIDFDDYPACGPDVAKPWGIACNYPVLGQDGPGRCDGSGACGPTYCKNSIECPDGWVCGCPPGQVCPASYCVPAPADGGYGDVCTVKGRCNQYAESPGIVCTSRQACDPGNIRPEAQCLPGYCDNFSNRPGLGCETDAICQVNGHPLGKCFSLQSTLRTEAGGDCGAIPGTTLFYVCCAGMQGDGVGGTPALGQAGRCQECCDTSVDDACFERSEDLTCCDGKCTDVTTDIKNCVSCNYDGGGYDCTDQISACNPGVAECDAINISTGCVMTEYCGATAQRNDWIAASCDIPQVPVPVPDCDYCGFLSPNPGKPCLTDDECGGFSGSCYRDPSLFCFVDRLYANSVAPECRVAPFTGCTPYCTELFNPPNVGSECDSDTDCQGGTTCKTPCDLSGSYFGGSAFCFSNPTCQW